MLFLKAIISEHGAMVDAMEGANYGSSFDSILLCLCGSLPSCLLSSSVFQSLTILKPRLFSLIDGITRLFNDLDSHHS